MDEKPDQIINDIDSQRERLGANLNELESRVRSATDWKTQFDRHPLMFLGAAVGGGMLLSGVLGSSGSSGRSYSGGYSGSSSGYPGSSAGTSYRSSGSDSSSNASSGYGLTSEHAATDFQRRRAAQAIDSIRGALIAYAANRAKEFLNELLPGFEQHYHETEKKAYAGSAQGASSQGSSPQGTSSQGSAQGTPQSQASGSNPYPPRNL